MTPNPSPELLETWFARIEYFQRPDTPSAGSPVGRLMLRIMDDGDAKDFEEARKLANEQIQKAAKCKKFSPKTVKMDRERKKAIDAALGSGKSGHRRKVPDAL